MVLAGSISLSLLWLILLVVFLVIEIITLGLTTIWFAGGALIAAIASMVGAPWPVQVLLFFAVSLVLLFLTRPVAVKYFNKDRVKTNVESMAGRQGVVISPVDNLQGTGQVNVDGQEWSARSEDDQKKYPAGTVVTVTRVQGVKLIVKEKQEEI